MSIYTNAITLRGFLGRDAVQPSNSNNTSSVVVLSLATKSSYKDRQSGDLVSRTNWHRIVVFGRLADSAKSLTKGSYVEVEGELQSREYTPESGDFKRRVWEVRARAIRKLERAPRAAEEKLDPEPTEEVPS